MENLAIRLKQCREEKDLTQAELAKKAGLKNQSIIGSLESGHRKNSTHIPAIAEALGINALWLSEGKGHKYIEKTGYEEAFTYTVTKPPFRTYKDSVNFHILDAKAACGNGHNNHDYPETVRTLIMSPEEAQRLIGSQNKNCAIQVILASKDSMVPAIQPDDLLFVDTSIKDYVGESVYILLHGGELVCKRLSLVGKELTVSSDNKAYPSWPWNERPEETKIIGKVIKALPMSFKKFGAF